MTRTTPTTSERKMIKTMTLFMLSHLKFNTVRKKNRCLSQGHHSRHRRQVERSRRQLTRFHRSQREAGLQQEEGQRHDLKRAGQGQAVTAKEKGPPIGRQKTEKQSIRSLPHLKRPSKLIRNRLLRALQLDLSVNRCPMTSSAKGKL